MTREEFKILDSWVYTKIKMNRDYYSRAKIIEMIMERVETLVKPNDLLHDVSQRTYFFDCWRKDGVLHCKEIVATCEEHAILKFEKKFDDYGYDPPYVG